MRVNRDMYERAALARDIEYITCMVEDAELADNMQDIENSDVLSPVNDDAISNKQINRMVDSIETTQDEDAEDEIMSIASANKDLSLDDVIGATTDIDKNIPDDIQNTIDNAVNTESTSLDDFVDGWYSNIF